MADKTRRELRKDWLREKKEYARIYNDVKRFANRRNIEVKYEGDKMIIEMYRVTDDLDIYILRRKFMESSEVILPI